MVAVTTTVVNKSSSPPEVLVCPEPPLLSLSLPIHKVPAISKCRDVDINKPGPVREKDVRRAHAINGCIQSSRSPRGDQQLQGGSTWFSLGSSMI